MARARLGWVVWLRLIGSLRRIRLLASSPLPDRTQKADRRLQYAIKAFAMERA
jgi:hypothetical protein